VKFLQKNLTIKPNKTNAKGYRTLITCDWSRNWCWFA